MVTTLSWIRKEKMYGYCTIMDKKKENMYGYYTIMDKYISSF